MPRNVMKEKLGLTNNLPDMGPETFSESSGTQPSKSHKPLASHADWSGKSESGTHKHGTGK